ncbi:MAG: hypothetical protein HOL17_10270 [Gammaproteobacteria bacterium]|jgi:hypothetical protein|nr:hypothetical protein [Thiotrichales bacterium]MBT5372093.1 hypothetical protein [Gammaproteobacteria bacterium]
MYKQIKWGKEYTRYDGSKTFRVEKNRNDLRIARFSRDKKYYVPIENYYICADVHYVSHEETRIGLLCNQEEDNECSACNVGHEPKQMTLMPVYDVFLKEVQIIAMSENCDPGSLSPQIESIMIEHGDKDEGQDITICISKPDMYSFDVQVGLPIKNGAKIMERKIKEFEKKVKAGSGYLVSCYTELSNDEMLQVEEINMMAEVSGYDLDDAA